LYAAELACLLALDGDLDRARQLALSARASTSPHVFVTEVTWRRALALVAAKEGRTDVAITLSDEARTRASAADLLTFRGQILEEAAIVHRLASDSGRFHTPLRGEEKRALAAREGRVFRDD
jgi:Flp pilus assembly protein TadD